ncbi:putative periplasmic oligopeptide-binding lipoprotein OppA [Mycobacterium tuberculosis H37Rv] [Mycobacterium shimoidei]|uniref:Putative periplasmic oligopeptide-binding lipoprotein OppA [Mycobacterium tuberculosis H37Rv] n=1 Tax=Mycobacterium shimoidei TaxID=29313 RepID=A0A375YZH7_MYCSH|nr:ABC transporter family substrate-binding protein [Mycobacterium shimoidei]SRX94247.1 putative periplasmic oligopeptide-binding lipoprotein OppA [Mycobacterium tuberculosis H37Rv] [Mycobacterium shimoidei]
MVRRLAVLAVAALSVVTGCSSGYQDLPQASAARVGTTSDINPHDPATLRDGGNLRLALTSFPENFNVLHIDGNTADVGSIVAPTLPGAFITQADGSLKVNTDYFTSVELTSTDPQVVTYTINPKAVWSDGTPLTWEDLKAEVEACSGRDERYLIASRAGFERVKSVTRGVDDRQAVVTFAQPYSEWRGMFAGGMQPRSMTSNPDVFNKGQLDAPGPSAGPFIVSTIDRAAQRIVLTRNPRWWGAKPRLDSITFLVLDSSAVIPALQNNAIDAAGVGTLDDMVTAQRTPGIVIRRAPAPTWYHFTFNGAPGSILADEKLRLAICRGIDRQAIVNVVQHGLTEHPVPLDNHVFVVGQVGYQNNSSPAAFDPEQARRDLDALGWKLNGAVREKDGKQLVIRDVFYDSPTARQIALVAQQNLAQVGVKLVLDVKPGTGFFSQYVSTGDFDIVQFGWVGNAFPLSALPQIYASHGDSNFGKIGNAEIDAKIDETLSELDENKARALANEVDAMIWQEGFSLPLFQSPGDIAVRSTLANFGATGLADVVYTAVGFTR